MLCDQCLDREGVSAEMWKLLIKSNSDCAGNNDFRGKSERGGKIV